MIRGLGAALDWLETRTGYRRPLERLLTEPLPAGVGWWFTLGSVLLLLIGVQVVTGLTLAVYYAPTPDHAWESVRFITTRVTFGRIVRNLHFYGASFLVVVAALHLLRVFLFGAYKRPRELTWVSGVLLLLLLMAFALTGYLLPWDQRAYWATVVTINIARTAPLAGELAASVLRGGDELGALTLSRWYAVHVLALPALLVALVVVHLYLMRRHRVSGPLAPVAGEERPFYPHHAVRDATIAGAVFVALMAFALIGDAPLEPVADPSESTYTPRPEWYFLWLFQMLKYFPGRLEVVGAHVVPALLVALLLLLPFLDRRAERRPWRRPIASTIALALVGGIGGLTWLGLHDRPPSGTGTRVWNAEALGGRLVASHARCTRCHREGGAAAAWERLRPERDDAWVKAHAADPEVIGPGVRPLPEGGLTEQEQRAVVAWTRAVRSGTGPPDPNAPANRALALLGANCLGCHMLDGQGRSLRRAPNLSRAGRERDAEWLAQWIANPASLEYDPDMPSFGDKLTEDEIRTIAGYLARRR